MALPDDFSGTIDDAYEHWRKLREEPASVELSPEVKRGSLSLRVAWSNFYQNTRYGFRTLSEAGIWALRRNGWARIDRNPEGSYFEEGGETWMK